MSLSSCESRISEYEGYIYHGKVPLDSVFIKENTKDSPNSTITNRDGYFKFKKSTKGFVPDLIFVKEGYKTDTVVLTRGLNLQGPYHLFLREESDTLKMNLNNFNNQ